MTTVLDLLFYLFLCGPVIALVACGWVIATDHPRFVSAGAISLGVVIAVTFISYWFIWGQILETTAADGSVPSPARLAINVVVWTGVAALIGLVGLVGVSTVGGMPGRRRHETAA